MMLLWYHDKGASVGIVICLRKRNYVSRVNVSFFVIPIGAFHLLAPLRLQHNSQELLK